MPFANIKRHESVPGQGIVKLKRCEQKTVYSIVTTFGQLLRMKNKPV